MRRLFWGLFWVFDAAVVLLFVAGYAARYLHPRHLWWVQLVAIGLPYVTLLLLTFTGVIMAGKHWKLASVHLVLVVLAAGRFWPLAGAATTPAADDLRVMTFNMGYPDARSAVPEMLALVRAEDPHVFASQEAYVALQAGPPHQIGFVAAYLRPLIDTLGYEIHALSKADTTFLREPVLSRGVLHDLEQRWLSRKGKTSVVRGTFHWKGREAAIYNIHLRSFGPKKPWQDDGFHLFDLAFWRPYLVQYRAAILDRAWEADQVHAMLAAETLPLIVSGDFNETVHGWVYARIAEGLEDAFATAGERWGGTYHKDLPLVRIDHILASPHWQAVTAYVPLPVEVSDHRALVAHLRWRTAE